MGKMIDVLGMRPSPPYGNGPDTAGNLDNTAEYAVDEKVPPLRRKVRRPPPGDIDHSGRPRGRLKKVRALPSNHSAGKPAKATSHKTNPITFWEATLRSKTLQKTVTRQLEKRRRIRTTYRHNKDGG